MPYKVTKFERSNIYYYQLIKAKIIYIYKIKIKILGKTFLQFWKYFKVLSSMPRFLNIDCCSFDTFLLCPVACGSRQKADMMFVVDSANAGKKNTKKVLDFMRSVVGDLDIDRKKIQLGLLSVDPCLDVTDRYSSKSSSSMNAGFDLNQFHTRKHLVRSLDSDLTDYTKLIRSLRKRGFRRKAGARNGARRIAVLIIDGELEDPLGTLLETQRIREEKGVEIYVISVGTELPKPEMMMMCNYPMKQNFYHVDSYDRLADVKQTLVDILCDGKFFYTNVIIKKC